LLLTIAGPLRISTVSGANLASRELHIADSEAGVTTIYKITLSGQSAGTIGSIRLQLCTNDPFPGTPCTAPGGLDFLGSNLASQSGMTGFSIHLGTTANELILTRVPAASVPGVVVFELTNVVNPAAGGSYFGRLETFVSTDATGASTDASGLAFAISQGQVNVQSVVPPYLLFCAGNTVQAFDCTTAQGNYVDFGEFSPTQTATGQTQMIVATNADFGYTIRVLGTTLTSGINVIPAVNFPDISRIGTSQFGLNLRANSTPPVGNNVQGTGVGTVMPDYNSPNFYKFLSGDVLVSSVDPDYIRLFTVTYIANISSSQAPGIYVSTLQYIALASF
jgi:hypothetical protein